LDGQNQDENIKIFCKNKSNKKSRFLIAKKSRFLARLINSTKSFCTVPFARLLLQGSFCKASFAKPFLQGYLAAFCKAHFAMLLLQGYILQGTFCKAAFCKATFCKAAFCKAAFCKAPYAMHFAQTYEHIPTASTKQK
jgi:hypothetical protein